MSIFIVVHVHHHRHHHLFVPEQYSGKIWENELNNVAHKSIVLIESNIEPLRNARWKQPECTKKTHPDVENELIT